MTTPKRPSDWAMDTGTMLFIEAEGELTLEEVALALDSARAEGRREGILESAEIVTDENADAENAEWGERPEMSVTVRAWLLNARARIRALATKESDS